MMNAVMVALGAEEQCPIHPPICTCCLQLSGVQELHTDTHMLHAMCADHIAPLCTLPFSCCHVPSKLHLF